MSRQQQGQHWNARAKGIQQWNPGGPDQRQSTKPQPTWLKVFIKSEARPAGVLLNRAAKLTVIG